jgi:hypothetical protein
MPRISVALRRLRELGILNWVGFPLQDATLQREGTAGLSSQR